MKTKQKKISNENFIKLFAATVWGSLIIAVILWYLSTELSISEFIIYISTLVSDIVTYWGVWGGILYIIIYTIRPLIFFPATVLTALSGALFGPVFGIIYTFIGENLSANLAFSVSRLFKKKEAYQASWIKKIDDEASKNGLITTLILRLIWAPFDVVNYGMGLTQVKQWEFALGTAIGILPGLIIFVLIGHSALGSASRNEIILLLSITVLLFILTIYLAKYLKKKFKHLDVVDKK